jgi:hypothetical protein
MLNEIFISLGVHVFLFIIFNNDLIKYILLHFLQLQLIYNTQVFEYLVKILSFAQASQVMNAGIKDTYLLHKFANSTDLPVFQYTTL